jgi:hypothetical protein
MRAGRSYGRVEFHRTKIYARSGARMTAELPLALAEAGRTREMNDPRADRRRGRDRLRRLPLRAIRRIFVN